MVKMQLKGEVGGSTLNDHGNYIVDHGKIMELCFLISVGIVFFNFCRVFRLGIKGWQARNSPEKLYCVLDQDLLHILCLVLVQPRNQVIVLT